MGKYQEEDTDEPSLPHTDHKCCDLPNRSSPKFPQPIFFPTRKLGPTISAFDEVPELRLDACPDRSRSLSRSLSRVCLAPAFRCASVLSSRVGIMNGANQLSKPCSDFHQSSSHLIQSDRPNRFAPGWLVRWGWCEVIRRAPKPKIPTHKENQLPAGANVHNKHC